MFGCTQANSHHLTCKRWILEHLLCGWSNETVRVIRLHLSDSICTWKTANRQRKRCLNHNLAIWIPLIPFEDSDFENQQRYSYSAQAENQNHWSLQLFHCQCSNIIFIISLNYVVSINQFLSESAKRCIKLSQSTFNHWVCRLVNFFQRSAWNTGGLSDRMKNVSILE